MKLSNNFTLEELTYSKTAEEKKIINIPKVEHIKSLQLLCDHILQPVRDAFQMPIKITSGYRSPELCLAVGSTIKSQHTEGKAADFEIEGIPNLQLANWIYKTLDFDQLILEFWNPAEDNSGWVHCSYNNNNNRREYLKAMRIDGKTVYSTME
ncbi:DUF882 domain-containing protein, partial [bacterium]|nr:DUF882 domain-containing protein [bacterium]